VIPGRRSECEQVWDGLLYEFRETGGEVKTGDDGDWNDHL